MKRLFYTIIVYLLFVGTHHLFAQQLTFSLEDKILSCEENSVSFDMKVRNFTDITTFQFGISWDPTVLQFDRAEHTLPPTILFNADSSAMGDLMLGWVDLNLPAGETIQDDSTIITLFFDLLGGAGSNTALTMGALPYFVLEANDVNGLIDNANIVFENGSLNVSDTVLPTISDCPGDTTINVAPGTGTTLVNWAAPMASDNCNLVSFTSNFLPNASFGIGTTEVKYIAIDEAGNQDSCTFDITVQENVNADKITFYTQNQSGSCANPTVSYDFKVKNFDTIQSFQYGIIWDANVLEYTSVSNNLTTSFNKDESNTAMGQLGIFWSDFAPPFGVTLPDDSTIFTVHFDIVAAGDAMSGVEFSALPGLVIEVTHPTGPPIPSSEYVLTSGMFELDDNVAPIIDDCPTDFTVFVPVGSMGTNVGWTAPTASDDCFLTSFVSTHAPNDFFNIGVTQVDYTARDSSGNESICSFNVTVQEDPDIDKLTFIAEEKILECGDSLISIDISVQNFDTISSLLFNLNWEPNVLEYIGHSTTLPPNSLFSTTNTATGELGWVWNYFNMPPYISLPDDTVILTLNFKAIGGVGDTSLITYSGAKEVIRNGMIIPQNELVFEDGLVRILDNTAPAFIDCPMDTVISTDSSTCAAVFSWTAPTATDVCSSPVVVSQIAGLNSGDMFPKGRHEIVYVAEDTKGNTDTCRFSITVEDNESPVFSNCPSNDTISAANDRCDAVVSYQMPSVSDNCGLMMITNNINSGDTLGLGVHTIEYIATDSSGNADTCSFEITVVDNTDPQFVNCPNDSIYYVGVDDCEVVVSFMPPTVSDNCGIETSSNNLNPGDTLSLGIHIASYIAVDSSGNSDTCTFELTVIDSLAPVLTCPNDTIIYTRTGFNDAQIFGIDPTVVENCRLDSIKFERRGVHNDTGYGSTGGYVFNLGSTDVIYSAYDNSGNTDSCSFNVEVIFGGVLIECPNDTTISNDTLACSALLSNIGLEITANVDSVATIKFVLSGATQGVSSNSGLNDASGTSFNIGTTNVLYTVIDTRGDSISCSFNVTVEDNEAPLIENCPTDITMIGNCTVVGNWNAPLISDNCALDTTYSSHQIGAILPVGDNVITYTALDTSGNMSTCSFIITVKDYVPPVIHDCPQDMVVYSNADSCNVSVSWIPPTAIDTCTSVSLTSNFSPGSVFGLGVHEVKYIAVDTDGNRDSCIFNITVLDTIAPVISNCPTNLMFDIDANDCVATVTWNALISTDNCGVDSTWSSHAPNDKFPIGTTTVEYRVFDASGNMVTCAFDVTVKDNVFPEIDGCPTDTIIYTSQGACDPQVYWTPPTATDNCNLSDFSSNLSPGDVFNVGTTSYVFYNATDGSGNTMVCQFSVQVIDDELPEFDCPMGVQLLADGTVLSDPDNFILSANSNNCTSLNLTFNTPTATDSCSTPVVTKVDMTGLNSGSDFPVGITTLSYEAIDAAGNIATCDIVIEIVAIPTLSLSASPSASCVGGDAQLIVMGGITGMDFMWTGPNNYSANVQNPLLSNLQLIDEGFYVVTGTSPSGACVYVDSIEVDVLPEPILDITHNDILCTDGSTDLTFMVVDQANTNIVNWDWSGPDNFASNVQNPTIINFVPLQSGVYTVIATTSDGCTSLASVDVMANMTPITPTLVPVGNDYDLCEGESATLLGTQYNSNNVDYNWAVTPTTGVVWNPSNNNSIAMQFDSAGVFEVSYWANVSGCPSDTATIRIMVEAYPVLDLQTNAPLFCTDGNEDLFLFENNGMADTYSWTFNNMQISSVQNPVLNNVTSAMSGVYTLTAVSGDGCMTQESINVEITDGPTPKTPTVRPDTSLCLGESVWLYGHDYNNANAIYHWNSNPVQGSGLINTSNNKRTLVSPDVEGVYEYSYHILVGGCSTDTVKTTITVDGIPMITAGYNDPLDCIAANTSLVLSETGGDAISWSWTGPEGFSSTDQDPVIPNISKDNAGIYELTIVDANGCSNTSSLSVNITEGLPALVITANAPLLCGEEDDLILETSLIQGASYIWMQGNDTLLYQGNRVLIPNVDADFSGVYTVVAETDEGCFSDVSSEVEVEILAGPECMPDFEDILFETPKTFNVLDNDVISGNPSISFTVSQISTPLKGDLTMNPKTGEFTYTPHPKALGEDYFTYEFCYDDCSMLCGTAVVTLYIDYSPNVCVVPTLITPNDDGKNDQLVISCVDAGTVPNNTLIIFNEWGGKVFEADPYLNDWDGTYKGEDLPDGTYFYIFRRDPQAKEEKGFITIFR